MKAGRDPGGLMASEGGGLKIQYLLFKPRHRGLVHKQVGPYGAVHKARGFCCTVIFITFSSVGSFRPQCRVKSGWFI